MDIISRHRGKKKGDIYSFTHMHTHIDFFLNRVKVCCTHDVWLCLGLGSCADNKATLPGSAARFATEGNVTLTHRHYLLCGSYSTVSFPAGFLLGSHPGSHAAFGFCVSSAPCPPSSGPIPCSFFVLQGMDISEVSTPVIYRGSLALHLSSS